MRAVHLSQQRLSSLPFILCGTLCVLHQSHAFDMNDFIQQVIASENPKGKMSDDEALCKFGIVGEIDEDACKIMGIPTASKTLDGIDLG